MYTKLWRISLIIVPTYFELNSFISLACVLQFCLIISRSTKLYLKFIVITEFIILAPSANRNPKLTKLITVIFCLAQTCRLSVFVFRPNLSFLITFFVFNSLSAVYVQKLNISFVHDQFAISK